MLSFTQVYVPGVPSVLAAVVELEPDEEELPVELGAGVSLPQAEIRKVSAKIATEMSAMRHCLDIKAPSRKAKLTYIKTYTMRISITRWAALLSSHSYGIIAKLTMLYGYVKGWLNFPSG